MKFVVGLAVGLVAGFIIGFIDWDNLWPRQVPMTVPEVVELPLEKYQVEKLAARTDWGSAIEMGELEATHSASSGQAGYVIQKFYFESDGDRVSGLAHVPDECIKCPVIAQFRGYYDRNKNFPGAGTRRTAAEFVKAGYITLAPDFLGYGESASPSADVFEARFQTYTTAVNLLYSIKSLEFIDPDRVGLWGHSNGGHIALTVLEITGAVYPAVVWAPVTAAFPYSILYYTDDYDDGGQALRKDLARFEDNYDVNKYTLVNYLDRINAPVLYQQGTDDPDIPIKWSRRLVGQMRGMDKLVDYVEYSGADHNMLPVWETAVARDIEFFDRYLGDTSGAGQGSDLDH